MRYAVEGTDLCIRIPLDAIAACAENSGDVALKVKDRVALALSVGRELCECESMAEEFYLSETLDQALGRVIDSADPSIELV